MPAYQVFVDGARDPSPAAVARLAAAIAKRYGAPAADVEARLARGRFRVKASVDRTTADEYARDLRALGAVVSIEPVAAGAAARQHSTPLPKPTAPREAPSTGLAAARTGTSQDLGVLGRDDAAVALATLDGDEEPMQVDPSPRFSPGATKVAPEPAPKPRPMTGPSVDLFTAPDDVADVQLAIDVDAERAQRAASAAETAAAGTLAPLREVVPLPPVRSPRDRARDLVASVRVRFAAGVVIALLLGFVPAHVVARVREDSAFGAIDRDVRARGANAASLDDYAALDRYRSRALERKYDERQNIAIVSMLIWAAAAAGIAYVWFRRVPWERLR